MTATPKAETMTVDAPLIDRLSFMSKAADEMARTAGGATGTHAEEMYQRYFFAARTLSDAVAELNRRAPAQVREEVVEECARVCDAYAEFLEKDAFHQHALGVLVAAKRIRALSALPSPGVRGSDEKKELGITRPDRAADRVGGPTEDANNN